MVAENFSKEIEQLALSSMNSRPDCLSYGVERLKEEDFYFLEHKLIFGGMVGMYKDDMTPALDKLIVKLKSIGSLDILGGVSGLVGFFPNNVFVKSDIIDYVKILKTFSTTRNTISAVGIAQKEIDKGLIVGNELLELGRDLLFKVASADDGDVGMSLREYYDLEGEALLKERHRRYVAGEPILDQGVATGMRDLDKMIGGLRGGNLVIIAARTSMGKTSLALNMATNIASSGKPVFFFSMEMGRHEIGEKIFSFTSGISARKFREGVPGEEVEGKIREYIHGVTGGNFRMSDRGGLKIEDIISISTRAKEKFNISAIFIDYLQLLYGDDKNTPRYLELSDITRRLKVLAKNLDIPVICLAQLSRKCDERAGHKPELSDMRESGSIEQDADLILGVLRMEYYDKFDRPGEATIFVMKNRTGPTCEINMLFDGETASFKDKPIQTFDIGNR